MAATTAGGGSTGLEGDGTAGAVSALIAVDMTDVGGVAGAGSELAAGAGVTGGTGSGRSADVSAGADGLALADCDGASGFAPSGLAASPGAGVSFAPSPLGNSSAGLLRLLSFCLAFCSLAASIVDCDGDGGDSPDEAGVGSGTGAPPG